MGGVVLGGHVILLKAILPLWQTFGSESDSGAELNVRFLQERDFFIQVEPMGIESVAGVVADTNLAL